MKKIAIYCTVLAFGIYFMNMELAVYLIVLLNVCNLKEIKRIKSWFLE